MGLDLHKLDHLIAVVEEGGFTRAAARLHMSQQALSASIRSLEREVGVELVDRGGGAVTPRPAAEALVADGRVLRGLARSALLRARRIGRSETEALRVGHTPAVTGEEVTALLRAVREEHPEIRTDVYQRYPKDLAAGLVGAELDLGLCRGMRAPHGLVRAALGRDRLAVAVRAGHRLADRERVALSELAGERFVVWGSPGSSGYTDFLLELCRRAGFEPRRVRNPVQGTPPVTAVIGGDDLAFVTAPPGSAAGGAVRVLRLEPPCHAPLYGLWAPHTTSDARDAFLDAAVRRGERPEEAGGGEPRGAP